MTEPNLFFTEVSSKYQINLPVIVIKHIHTIIIVKDGKHGLAYGFWLNKVFAYFIFKCGKGKVGSVKQIFNITTLEDHECIPRRAGGKSKSIITNLIDVQTGLREELEAKKTVVPQL